MFSYLKDIFHNDFVFISRLKFGHKLLIPKIKTNWGVTDFVSEKKAREKCPNFDRWVIITSCSVIYLSVENRNNILLRVTVAVHRNIGAGFLDNRMPLGMA